MRIAIALNSIFIVHLGFKPVSHRHSINTGAGWRSSFWPSRDDAGTDLGSFIHLLRYPYLTGLTDFRLDALRRLFSSNFINLFVLLFGRPFLFDLPLLPIGFLHRVDCSVPPKDKYGAVALNASPFSWWYIAPPSQRLYVGVSILRAAYSAPNKLRGGAGRTRTSNQTNSNALSFGCVITARWSRFPQLARFEATVRSKSHSGAQSHSQFHAIKTTTPRTRSPIDTYERLWRPLQISVGDRSQIHQDDVPRA